ncbi:MAG: DUF6072 family protein [Nannocystaceae bacterium]
MGMDKTISNAIKLAGEVATPGASLLLDGKILAGSAHMLVGMWSRAVLGPVGLGLVMANSYSKSTTGKNLLKQFSKADELNASESKEAEAPAETAESAS